jgi:hypothetical protein
MKIFLRFKKVTILLILTFFISACEMTDSGNRSINPFDILFNRINVPKSQEKLRDYLRSYSYSCPVDRPNCSLSNENRTSINARLIDYPFDTLPTCVSNHNRSLNLELMTYFHTETTRCTYRDITMQMLISMLIINIPEGEITHTSTYSNLWNGFGDSATLSKDILTGRIKYEQGTTPNRPAYFTRESSLEKVNTNETFINNAIQYSFGMTLTEFIERDIFSNGNSFKLNTQSPPSTSPARTPEVSVPVAPTYEEIRINSGNFSRYFSVRTTEDSNAFPTSISLSKKSDFEVVSINYTMTINAVYRDGARRSYCEALSCPMGLNQAQCAQRVNLCVAEVPSYSINRTYNVGSMNTVQYGSPSFNYRFPAYSSFNKSASATGLIRVKK